MTNHPTQTSTMTSFWNNIFPRRDRRSRVPWEEVDMSPDLNVEEEENGNDVTSLEEGRERDPDEPNQGQDSNRFTSNQENESLTISGSNNDSNINNNEQHQNNSDLPTGSLSLSQQQRTYFQIMHQSSILSSQRNNNSSNSNRYTRTETTDDEGDDEGADGGADDMNRTSNDNTNAENSQETSSVTDENMQTHRGGCHRVFRSIFLFILFKLWIEALATGDSSLLLICIAATIWLYGFVQRHQQMIHRAGLDQNGTPQRAMTEEEQMLEQMGISYQAQLNSAIWESRMLAMMGGISTNETTEDAVGVSENSKSRWQCYDVIVDSTDKKGHYGRLRPKKTSNLSEKNSSASSSSSSDLILQNEEDATCSICLCEYENNDQVVRLSCSHLYHYDCISSWTKNHVRCPLCNYDLEACDEDTNGTASIHSQSVSTRSDDPSPLQVV